MKKHFSISILSTAILAFSLFTISCQQTANQTSNTETRNTNNQPETNVSNTNSPSTTSTSIEANEPEQYTATITLKFETTGEKNMAVPPLTAQVARNGAASRLEFSLPNGEKMIYLDLPDKHLLISPTRKQYAELNQESTGFEIRRLMTPGEIVERLKTLQGYERVGEEQVNGRTAIKYSYAKTADTKTKAGNIETEAVVFVDKETGLPLRSETVSQSQNANVKGVTGLKLVTEMSNIQTSVNKDLFNEPTDLKKVQPEEVRQQINTLFNAAAALLGQLMQQQAGNNGNSPSSSPTPSSSPAKK